MYFVEFDGKRRYFSVDPTISEKMYRDAIKEWSAWRDAKERQGKPGSFTILDLAERYIESRLTDTSKDQWRWSRSHLRRLVTAWPTLPAAAFDSQLLQAMKTDLATSGKLAAKTINHDLHAIKAMFLWGADMGYLSAAPNLRAVKDMPLEQRPQKAVSIEAVTHVLRLAITPPRSGESRKPNPKVLPWLAINYLAALRPSEVVRLVHQDGDWIGHGLFQPRTSKTHRDGRASRIYLLSDAALKWLAQAEPVWSGMKEYGAAVRRACGPGFPHPLRHSAATHLLQSGLPRADVEICLGHYPRGMSTIYARVEMAPHRLHFDRIALPACIEPIA